MRKAKKFLSLILCLCLFFNSVAINTMAIGANQSTSNSVKSNSLLNIDGVAINCDQQLIANFDGTYSYWLRLQTNFSHQNQNNDSNLAQNSYFTVKQPGTYLVELWGGNGGTGEDTSYSKGGNGGQGGHIYGTVELKAGETLFYSIGGNGSATVNNTSGGGANGPGGNHGDLGSYNVGGGGGYSAVYKFAPGEFESKYFDRNNRQIKDEIDEADRLSHYLMIAGGGGGGGAGNGFSFGTTATGRPDGGNGGSIDSLSGSLSGNSYSVEGDFFSGSDGKSSGTSTEFVGRGATNAPGIISESILSFFSGEGPNDWSGTANPNFVGGAGGSGQFRGGAGGAGFCGGSGGLMPTLVAAVDIGGGGGGSSFISNEVNYKSMTQKAQQALTNSNPSATGGAVNITYIDETEKTSFNQIELETSFSEYIDIHHVNSLSGKYHGSNDGTRTHLKISEFEVSSSGPPASVEVVFSPKARFAGGNDVPIFMNDKISLSAGVRGNTTIDVDQKCGYFNCPIKIVADGVSQMTNDSNKSYTPTDLYTDRYTTARVNPSQYWPLRFIESMGEYVVKDEAGNIITGPISPNITTKYTVGFDVVPKPCTKAVIGEVNKPMMITDIATITILSSSNGTLNGTVINYSKSLEYDENSNQYYMSLNLGAGVEGQAFDKPPKLTVAASQADYIVSTTSNIKPGYYLIQAWGGNGGNGYGRYGGKGAKGGYVDGFVHLNEGDKIKIYAGKNGEQGYNSRAGGFGGTESRIVINETNTILVAGGGGAGGGHGGLTGIMGGSNATDSTAIITDPLAVGSQNGGRGGTGESGPFGAGGAAGVSGGNYESTSISQGLDKLNPESQQIVNKASKADFVDSNTSGAVWLTCLQIDANQEIIKQENRDKLDNYSLSLDLSNYFDAVSNSIIYTGIDGTPTASYSGKKLNITGINPTIIEKTTPGSGVTTISLSFNCAIKIPLKTIDGFWGGNDVPILNPTNDSVNNPNMVLSQDATSLSISSRDETDYANVSINYNPVVNAIDKNYISGGATLNKTDLYNWSNRPDLTPQYVCDFVKIEEPNSEILAPRITTSYRIEVGVAPKAEPLKATVIPKADPKTVFIKPTVHVDYQVFYNLKDAKTDQVPNADGQYIIDSSKNFVAILSGAQGYDIPKTVKVVINNKELTNYSYNPKTGKLMISKAELTGPISIYAQGVPMEYELNFIYELKPGFGQETKVEKHIAGEALNQTFADTYSAPAFDGYEFKWDWATTNNHKLDVMPSQNWWVIGKYIAKDYTLTINYHKDGQIIDTKKSMVTYGSTYKFITPDIKGYVADKVVLNDVMPAKDLTLDVYYTSTANELNIIYIMSDTNKEFKRVKKTFNQGDEFNEVSPTVEGYTPDAASVNGVMGSDGYTQYVYYSPNTYVLTFDSAGGSCSVQTKNVVFNKQYNYDGVDYIALPTPIKLGYKFDGWYLADQKILDSSIVKTSSNHTLVAKWISATYTLNIKYNYESGEKAYEDYTAQYSFGSAYSVDTPAIKGYTPDKLSVTGNMGATNTQVIVTYKANEYKLTINYLKEDGSKAFEPLVEHLKFNTKYSYIPPTLTNYNCSTSLISGVMAAEDKIINVYYYENAPVISTTVEWGEMTFDYTRGIWNTDTVSYSEDTITPSVDGANRITVSNGTDSTVPVIVEYSYNAPFNTLKGFFTVNNDNNDTRITEQQIPVGAAKDAYYWLEGSLDKDKVGNISCGECKIVIRGDR